MPQAADWIRSGILAAVLVAAAALAQAGCGSGDGSPPSSANGSGEPAAKRPGGDLTATAIPQSGGGAAAGGHGSAGHSGGADPYSEGAGDSEAALVQSVRAYVSAIDRRDAQAVCELLVPGALRGVHLSQPGGGCADAVQASIGYSAAGEAAWQRTEIRRIGPIELDPRHPGEARVRVTVVHRYNHHREPSVEDDLIYLRQQAGRWLVAKPSSTFYRAIGSQNVPLSALTPP